MVIVTNNIISKLLFNESCKYHDVKFSKQYQQLNTLVRLFNPTHMFWLMPEFISRRMKKRQELIAATQALIQFSEESFAKRKPKTMSDKEPECVSDLLWLEIVPQVLFDLFVAGQETTASTLTWACLNMMHYPDIQDRVYEELSKEFPDVETVIPYSAATSLPYTMATINESQRCTPVNYTTIDHVAIDDVHNFNGFFIPKGTRMFANLALLHKKPSLWMDVANFNPKNFLDENGVFVKSPHLIPFGIGLRSCPGEIIAKLEMFLVFANLFRRYRVKPVGELPALRATIGLVAAPPNFEVVLGKRDR